MPDVLERPLDSRVPPSMILPCHADDQVGDDLHDPWSARGSTFVRPLLGNELSVPTQDRVGSDDRCHLDERPSPDGFTPNRESAALVVGQSESSATELLLENAVLFAKIVDGRVLLARDPSSHRGHEDLPWIEHGRHPLIVASPTAVRQLSSC